MLTFKEELKKRIEEIFPYYIRFAEEIGVNHATVTQWLFGITYPNMKNLQKICELLSWDYNVMREQVLYEKRQRILERVGNGMSIEKRTNIKGLEHFLKKLDNLPPTKQERVLLAFNEMLEATLNR